MKALVEVLAIYSLLGFIATSAAWALIAHHGFTGLQQTNSPLARFFRTRFTVITSSAAETNATVVVDPLLAPVLATSVLLVTVVISCGGIPRSRSKYDFVPCKSGSPMEATTAAPETQVIDADLH
ncbi:MAG: hypothetical protein WCC97_10770 [Candidatus Acidiferrales bacterium]